jgi:predicted nucleotidyltransferase
MPDSDKDVQGFCIPPKEMIFPGTIPGFLGTPTKGFEQWINTNPDFTIFGIVKFFNLILNCNPNIIDVLFVPERCVIHSTKVGQIVRDSRHVFLSKKAYHSFKGYAYSQSKKIQTKNPTGKRSELVEKFGYDTKFAYHIVRLMNECRQILESGDLNLESDSQMYISIREGAWTLDYLMQWFDQQIIDLEHTYNTSTLRYGVDNVEVTSILMSCLEEHYGDLSSVVTKPSRERQLKAEIQAVLDKYAG